MGAIDEFAIPLVLLRVSNDERGWTHLHQIEEALTLYSDRWELIFRDTHSSPNVFLYRIRGNTERRADIAKLSDLSAPRSLVR